MLCTPEWIKKRLAQAERLWLFLDYDGTLADFAPTPEHVNPDPQLIDLLAGLASVPHIRVAVISGRRLAHVQKLVPVAGALLAGTYGIELQTPEGERVNRVMYDLVRPALDALKPRWRQLLAGREGFFLEDKGWALALHARFANDDAAKEVLAAAQHMAVEEMRDGAARLFRLLGGQKFLEISPSLAHKGRTIIYLLERFPWPDALLLYLGDDDKDEEAFGIVKALAGIAVLVAAEPRDTQADCRLASPQAARRWLEALLARLKERDILHKGDTPIIL
jgi:trehalose 6-phosphate phosphatase